MPTIINGSSPSITFSDTTTQTTGIPAPSTNGNFLRSNGTTWVSEAVTVGTVTSVATGNGLSGGTITSTGTLALACPAGNTVGSYASVFCQRVVASPVSVTLGSNYAAGGSHNQLTTYSIYADGVDGSGNGGITAYNSDFGSAGSISGTWKWMSKSITTPNDGQGLLGIGCRVS
jgi:hypothetical protein